MKNSVQHSRTKHIEVRHQFIWDPIEKGNIIVEFVPSHLKLVDTFTKPFGEGQFYFIQSELDMLKMDA